MTTENTSTTKILIIEDEIAIAEGLIDLCKLNGYRRPDRPLQVEWLQR